MGARDPPRAHALAPQGPASSVPSSCSCSSLCSSPRWDCSPSLQPAKSPAHEQPRATATDASQWVPAPQPRLPVPGASGSRSAGRRGAAALPMAQPESRLVAPDRLDRGAAQVSAAGVGWGLPERGVARRGAVRVPSSSVSGLGRASAKPKVSRGWTGGVDAGGARETRGFPSSPAALAPQLRRSPEGLFFLPAGIRVSDLVGWILGPLGEFGASLLPIASP